jgi:hypothetical protein
LNPRSRRRACHAHCAGACLVGRVSAGCDGCKGARAIHARFYLWLPFIESGRPLVLHLYRVAGQPVFRVHILANIGLGVCQFVLLFRFWFKRLKHKRTIYLIPMAYDGDMDAWAIKIHTLLSCSCYIICIYRYISMRWRFLLGGDWGGQFIPRTLNDRPE